MISLAVAFALACTVGVGIIVWVCRELGNGVQHT